MSTADVASHTASHLARLTKDGSLNRVYSSRQRRRKILSSFFLPFEMELDSRRKASAGYALAVRAAKVFLTGLLGDVGRTGGIGVRQSDVNYYSAPFPVISYGS